LDVEEALKPGEALTTEERVARLEEAFSGLEGKELADRVNRFSLAMMAVHRDRPDLAREAFGAIEEAFTDIDFGKMREAVIAVLDYGAALASRAIEAGTANPVIIANLVGIFPALVNSLIGVGVTVLEATDLPPEILASALFNTLTALDAEQLGRALTALSAQVNDLHAGNYILGGDEPRARAVADALIRRVLDNLDIESAASAVVALGEDTEVITGALVEIVSRDPELIDVATRAVVGLSNIGTRVLSNAMKAAADWPDEVLARIGVEGRVMDTVDAAAAVDSFVTYALRLRNANPGLHRELYTRALQAVNTERVDVHLRTVAGDLKHAAAANPGVRKALEPEELGRRISEMLAGFNRAAGSAATSDYLTRLFRAIDSRELETAVRTTTGGLLDAAFTSADTARSLLKAAASNALRLVKNLFNLIVRK
jgi:hypothetical protein